MLERCIEIPYAHVTAKALIRFGVQLMARMKFSIVYWNIWLDNQTHSTRAKALLGALDSLIKKYEPDCFGLSEVLMPSSARSKSQILTHLKKRGYTHVHYLASGPWTQQWDIGDAIVSKYPLKKCGGITLGDHYTVEGKDPSGQQAQAAEADVVLSQETTVRVIVAHLMNLRIHKLPTHFKHQKSLTGHYSAKLQGQTGVIAGGDFNEPTFMPFSFARRNRRHLNVRTGSVHTPTWFKNANKQSLLRANPDKVFWSKNSDIQLDYFRVIADCTSDHRPLYARFLVGESS